MIKNLDYKKFARGFHDFSREKRLPLRAMLELTYRCNFNCIHCYLSGDPKKSLAEAELKTKEVYEILSQLKDLGCFYLGLTGGEIFLRRDILDIIWYARRKGFQVILLTNGSLINKGIANELRKLRVNKVDITVHAMDENIFDQITRIPGSAEKVFRGIDLLYKSNVPLVFKSCQMQANREEILRVNEYAKELNVPYRCSGGLLPRQDGSKIPLRFSISPEEEYLLNRLCYPEAFAEKAGKRRFIHERNPTRVSKRLFNCGAGYTELTINPYGEVKICTDIGFPRYNILEGNLATGWERIKTFIDSLKPPRDWACRSCELEKFCSWCPAKAYLEDGNYFSCTPDDRKRAEFAKKLYEKGKC